MELKKKFVLGFMTLALAVSCGNKSDKNNAKDSSVNKPEVEIVNNNDAGDKERKLKKFIDIKDELNSEEWDMMFKEINPAELKTADGNFKEPGDKSILSLAPLGKSKELIEDYSKDIVNVLKTAPKMDVLDRNAQSLLQNLIEENRTLSEIEDYYKNGKYKQDNLSAVDSLNNKYKAIYKKRMESYETLVKSIEEYAGKEIKSENKKKNVEKLPSGNGKIRKNMESYVEKIEEFKSLAFEKDSLKYSIKEADRLRNVSDEVKILYGEKISKIQIESLSRNNIDIAEFEKFRELAHKLTEDSSEFVAAVRSNDKASIAKAADKYLNDQTDLVNSYNNIQK